MNQDHAKERRTIRSFVRRTGRLTASQQRALDELWPVFGIPYSDQPLDLQQLFGRGARRTLEIGFGNGDTFVQQALAQPEVDFLGIEVHEPGIGHCLIGMRESGIRNCRLINHDAIEVLGQQLAEHSIDRINLYFPDPWPKKRHHKRRIVSDPFLKLCATVLRPGGTLHIATDWDNYAEHIDATVAASRFFETLQTCVHQGDRPLDRPRTKFETRGLLRGHQIHDWIFITAQ